MFRLVFTLSVYDMENPGRDYAGYSQGGTRRTLVIGSADFCDELMANLDVFFGRLKLWTVEEEMIIVADQKLVNRLTGKKQN